MIDKINLISDFLRIARAMAKVSKGNLQIRSYILNKKTRHFLELNKVKVREDIEFYGEKSTTDGKGHALPEFFFLIDDIDIRMDCPASCKKGIIFLRQVGNKILSEEYLPNWKRFLDFTEDSLP